MFQDLYPWAGQLRTVNMSKDITDFAPLQQITAYIEPASRVIRNTDWPNLTPEQFGDACGKVFAYINQAHPFREGNGRTSKVFMSHVAELAPYELHFDKISPEVWNAASMLSGPDRGQFEPQPAEIQAVFKTITQPRAQQQHIDLGTYTRDRLTHGPQPQRGTHHPQHQPRQKDKGREL